MSNIPPVGVKPIFLRGVTCEKFGLKTGEGVNDLIDNKYLIKEEIMKEITIMGVMSDFEPAKKLIEAYQTEQILIVIDKEQKYGETFLLILSDEARDNFMNTINEAQEALREQLKAEMEAEEARKAAEYARLNVVFEDKPLLTRERFSETSYDTENEIASLSLSLNRELISIEVSRPRQYLRMKYNYGEKTADSGGPCEFRSYKDPTFKTVRESEKGIQVAGVRMERSQQTPWYRSVNKALQCDHAVVSDDPIEGEELENLMEFLEEVTDTMEQALQQNESVDIFLETFHLEQEDDYNDIALSDNDLREIKNFADPTYSKSKPLAAIDWVPRTSGLVAVSAVRNLNFDQRVALAGQTSISYILIWDFRILVKPLVMMQSQHEIFTFRFNRTQPSICVAGCITGQVMLWETRPTIEEALLKLNRNLLQLTDPDNEDGEGGEPSFIPLLPKVVSSVDHSHRKSVADLFWLPPTTQINYRGQLVGEEHLDGKSHQFITIAGDGYIMIWDIRYEKIFNDELRHIGRTKHVPMEKSFNVNKESNKPLWAPIFKTHLKRLEGIGELSCCRICPTAGLFNTTSKALVHKNITNNFGGNNKTQFLIATEEGDIVVTDLAARRGGSNNDNSALAGLKDDLEVEEEESEVSCIKWICKDNSRPSVGLQESPFFPHIVLSVSDWNFHLWKLGDERPVFTSPVSESYLTFGVWSISRPAVLYISCADGTILVWDFTDTSFGFSLALKATTARITSMDFLHSANSHRYQLLAVGDELGILHIFEIPRNLTKTSNKEMDIMTKFLDRELARVDLFADYPLNENGEEEEQEGNEDPDNPNPNRRIHVSEIIFASSIDINPPPVIYPPDEIAKEDEEFAKFEASYLVEVNLPPERINRFRGPPIVHAPTTTKRGAKQQQQQQKKQQQQTT